MLRIVSLKINAKVMKVLLENIERGEVQCDVPPGAILADGEDRSASDGIASLARRGVVRRVIYAMLSWVSCSIQVMFWSGSEPSVDASARIRARAARPSPKSTGVDEGRVPSKAGTRPRRRSPPRGGARPSSRVRSFVGSCTVFVTLYASRARAK